MTALEPGWWVFDDNWTVLDGPFSDLGIAETAAAIHVAALPGIARSVIVVDVAPCGMCDGGEFWDRIGGARACSWCAGTGMARDIEGGWRTADATDILFDTVAAGASEMRLLHDALDEVRS